ncbi:hypothetical protein GCM10022419_086300 [Nonomuraea rosea]|uniref:Uncharacterized protein n=1 Tax=Nonomuraea rosea TaxID=638574 RepID=A0ABP6YYG9_9ACTN
MRVVRCARAAGRTNGPTGSSPSARDRPARTAGRHQGWPTWPAATTSPAATIRRRRDELVTLPAAKAPRVDRALKKIARRGGEVVLIDGTLISTAAPGRLY